MTANTRLAAATAEDFPDGTVFCLSDVTKAARWRLEWLGNALNLCDASGLVIVVSSFDAHKPVSVSMWDGGGFVV